jgi:hypothetical protein
MLVLTLACTTAADALVNYSMYVPQRPRNFPSPRWETHVVLVVCRAAVSLSRTLASRSRSRHPRSMRTQRTECVLMFEISHRLDGKIADMLAPTHTCTTANTLVNNRGYVPQRPCKFSIAPMGDSRFARCSQGGGIRVGVYGRSVTIVNSQIYSNTASNVCNRLQNFPSPRWKNG